MSMIPEDADSAEQKRRKARPGAATERPSNEAAPPDPDDVPHFGTAAPGAAANISSGLAVVEHAVQFTNKQVLDPTAGMSSTGMDVGANTLAEQAGAMMIQDMRSFLQSIEMVMIPATARALEESLNANLAGPATLLEIALLMDQLGAFSAEIIADAGAAGKAFA
jgi:hypothetical protein